MKKTLIAIALACLMLLPACSDPDAPVTYRSDLTPQEITDACAPALTSYQLLSAADADYIKYRLLLDDNMMESCAVYIQNAGTSIDEFGIIKSRTEYTDAVEAAVSDYLIRRNDEWTGQYLVEEYPKLQAADYKTFGQYTVYAILSEADKETFYSAVTDLLAEE